MIKKIKNHYSYLSIISLFVILVFYIAIEKLFVYKYPNTGNFLVIVFLFGWKFLMHSSFLLYLIIIMKKSAVNIKNELKISVKKIDVLAGILSSLVILFVSSLIVYILQINDKSIWMSIINNLINDSHQFTLIFLFFYISFYGPIIEEIVIRGFIWKIFEGKNFKNFIILLITSLIFAFMHMEIKRFLIFFIMGLILGILRMRTNRLGASIIAHIVINIIGFL